MSDEPKVIWSGRDSSAEFQLLDDEGFVSAVVDSEDFCHAATFYFSKTLLEELYLKLKERFEPPTEKCGCRNQSAFGDEWHSCKLSSGHTTEYCECICGKKWKYNRDNENRPEEVKS